MIKENGERPDAKRPLSTMTFYIYIYIFYNFCIIACEYNRCKMLLLRVILAFKFSIHKI